MSSILNLLYKTVSEIGEIFVKQGHEQIELWVEYVSTNSSNYMCCNFLFIQKKNKFKLLIFPGQWIQTLVHIFLNRSIQSISE
jgi:hypothetical protein